jgi:hypothetical protein
MAPECSTQARHCPGWPQDDNGECVVGSETGPAHAVPFQAVRQVTLLGLRRRDHETLIELEGCLFSSQDPVW